MSKLNASIGEAMYSVKKWLGVNESPDGDTNLKDGEAAVMHNWRITDGGAIRKRPGSAVVAGLLNSYSVSVGEEKLVRSEVGKSVFGDNAYVGVNVNDSGEILFSGDSTEINLTTQEECVGLYYKSNDAAKAWQHTRVKAEIASGHYDGDGGAINVAVPGIGNIISGGISNMIATVAYSGAENHDPIITQSFSVYHSFTVQNGVITLGDKTTYTGVTEHGNLYNKLGWPTSLDEGGYLALYKHSNGTIYQLYKTNSIGFSDGTTAGYIFGGTPITEIIDDYYEWYANEVTNTPNTADTIVRGIWSGYVGDTEYIIAACNGHLWSLAETDGVWSKTDIGVIDTTDHVCLFGFDSKLYVLDGKDYSVWDGTNFTAVAGYIPLIGVGSSPAGSTTTLERINLLTAQRRQRFSSDGSSTAYQLAEQSLASIDKVEVDGAEVSGYTVNADTGKVTFSSAPGAGVDNVEIWYTAKEDYRSKVAAMRYAEFFNGANDSRVFIYGDGSNITLYSDVQYDTGLASAEYFPDLNEIAIGDSNTPITALIRQYSRLMAFKHGGSAWSIYYDSMTLADGTTTAGFYCNGVNRSIGNDALGQVCLVENKPRTVDGRSIYEWQSSSGGYITNDQRNAKRISQKVEATLLGFDLAKSIMFFDKINHEFFCVYKGTAVVENIENGAWYIYKNFPAVALIVYKDELYYGTEAGDLRRFSDDYTDDSGNAIDCYWESGSMSFGRDYAQKYSPSVWVGLKQEANAAVTVGIETDRDELITEEISLSADSDAMPRMNRRRLKAQKFTYYKLIFQSNSAETRATVVAADVKVKYNINVK